MVRFRTDDDDETVVVTPDAMTAINKLAAAVARVGAPSNTPRGKKSRKHKATVAVYGGRVTATGYLAFAGADYRLATAATAFSLPEVTTNTCVVILFLFHHTTNTCLLKRARCGGGCCRWRGRRTAWRPAAPRAWRWPGTSP